MRQTHLRKGRLALAITASSLTLLSMPATAITLDFNNPDLTGRLDTTIGAGALFRTESQDAMLAATGDPVDMTMQGFGSQLNKNDANNNFDRGLASVVYRVTPTLDIAWQNRVGVYFSGTAFYDSVIMDGDHDGGILRPSDPFIPPNGITRFATFSQHPNNGLGSKFTPKTRTDAGRRARVLAAYAWADVELFDRPITIRAGRQVINWGEAIFFQGGINTANFFDLNTLRQPGGEIREALLPLGSVSFSYGLSLNTSFEGFYQFEWANSEDAPVGTYFSTHDSFPAVGAQNVIIDGRVAAFAAGAPGLENAFAQYTFDTYGESGVDYGYEQTQVTVNRAGNINPDGDGQFGLAFRYFAEQLNGTEFAAYYTRTHARLPVVAASIQNLNRGGGAIGMAEAIDTSEYRMFYPEDIDMFGLSFNTTLASFSMGGELAYRPKRPIINETGDNLIQAFAATAGASALQGQDVTLANLTDHCVRLSPRGGCVDNAGTPVEEGQLYYFYDEVDSYNLSLVNIFNLGPRLGAQGIVALVELGVEHVSGLENKDLLYNSNAAILFSEAETLRPDNPERFYLDKTSYGYRALMRATYSNVFQGVSVAPRAIFAHDVKGNSPLGGNFLQDRRAATLGVAFTYNNDLEFDIAATTFWGADYANKLGDRDNVAASVRYSF